MEPIKMILKKRAKKLVAVAVVFLFLGACSKPRTYIVKTSVTSKIGYGVILHEIPVVRSGSYYTNANLSEPKIRVYPSIPGNWVRVLTLPPFENYESRELPDNITIRYQYAELNDCGVSRSGHPDKWSLGSGDFRLKYEYYTKDNCDTWLPIADKVFEKTFSLGELNNSKEMKLLGSKNRSGHRIGTTLMLEFNDDGSLEMSLENYSINPWR